MGGRRAEGGVGPVAPRAFYAAWGALSVLSTESRPTEAYALAVAQG